MVDVVTDAGVRQGSMAPTLESVMDYLLNRNSDYSEFENAAWTQQARSLVRLTRQRTRQRPAPFYPLGALPRDRWFYQKRDDEYRFLAERSELTTLLIGCLKQSGWKIEPE